MGDDNDIPNWNIKSVKVYWKIIKKIEISFEKQWEFVFNVNTINDHKLMSQCPAIYETFIV